VKVNGTAVKVYLVFPRVSLRGEIPHPERPAHRVRGLWPPATDADVVILAGDIGVEMGGLQPAGVCAGGTEP